MNIKRTSLQMSFFLLVPFGVIGQKQMEWLGRGEYAAWDSNRVFVSWRLLATDDKNISFNIYRAIAGRKELLNNKPLSGGTNYVDKTADPDKSYTYSVVGLKGNREISISGNGYQLIPGRRSYLSIPLKFIEGYTPNDVSVGDVDGDGEYEIILHQVGISQDNSQSGFTSPPIFQCYKLDGRFLWQINLGKNIREGAHYTQFMVYDLDGDGKAEIAMKTADGTLDGLGKFIGDPVVDYRYNKNDKRRDGRILDGPEYFSVFSGETGAVLATVPYVPGRGNLAGWGGVGGNGGNDDNGNRVDRFLAGVAYLDGKHPSVIMCRGYYGRSALAAWDWRNKKLTLRWLFDSKDSTSPYSGMGNHNLAIADVDGDGKDEIVYGSMCIDDDGKGLYSTGLRHGDAVHVTDIDPVHPGQEVFGIHELEEGTKGFGTAMFDAATGKLLFAGDVDNDVGRGLAADIDPRYPGLECWGGREGLQTARGAKIGPSPKSINFRIWWDGDLLSELLDDTRIDKWDYKNGQLNNLFNARDYNCLSNNGSKATPALSADLFGDWREEVIFRTWDNKELRIFSTTLPSDHRIPSLMQNPQYRVSIAWQNVAYNQPPYTDYFLGDGMQQPDSPTVIIVPIK